MQINKPCVLLGTACGDALGVSHEGKKTDNPKIKNWDGTTYLGSEWHKLKPGQYSDDTIFSKEVAQSLIQNGFDPNDLAKRYVKIVMSPETRGYGDTTKKAIDNLANGVHWSKSGMENVFGNGSMMRSASFGSLKTINDVVEATKIDGRITHNSIEPEAGAIAMAVATHFLINYKTFDIKEVCGYLPDSFIKDNLLKITDLVNSNMRPEDALDITKVGFNVKETTMCVFYTFLKFDNFHEALKILIRKCGDADTNAACVGALFGARDGMSIFTDYDLQMIEDRDRIIELDRKLYGE